VPLVPFAALVFTLYEFIKYGFGVFFFCPRSQVNSGRLIQKLKLGFAETQRERADVRNLYSQFYFSFLRFEIG
jgi:hypothetical protein